MPSVPDAVAIRGEWISLILIAAAMAFSVRPLSRLLALPRNELGDLFWNGALAFVVVGRLAYLALESPEALTDPLVLIRIQGGIEPLAGLVAVGALLTWRTRDEPASRLTWLAAASAGLAIAVVVYDVGCVARDGCTGIEAPGPLGFAMSGLSETRIATPLIEAALLLLAGGVLLSSELGARRGLIALGGVAAALRVAFTPLSVVGSDALGLESVLFAALAIGAAVVAWRGERAVPKLATTAATSAVDDARTS